MVVTLGATNDMRTYLANKYTYGAVGSSNTTPSENDTTLTSEVVRNAESSSSTATDKEFTKEITINSTQGNGNFFREIGLFDAASSGNMLNHSVVPELEKNSTIEIIYDITVQIVNV